MFPSRLVLSAGLISFLLLILLISLSLSWWELIVFVGVALSGYGISFGIKWSRKESRLKVFMGVILLAFSLIIAFSNGSVIWPFKSHGLLTVVLLSTVFLVLGAYLAEMALKGNLDIPLSKVDRLFLSSVGVGLLISLWLRIYFRGDLLLNNLPLGLLTYLIIYPAVVGNVRE